MSKIAENRLKRTCLDDAIVVLYPGTQFNFLCRTDPSEIVCICLVHAFLSPSLVSMRLWTLSVLSNDAVHVPKIVPDHNKPSFHICSVVKR